MSDLGTRIRRLVDDTAPPIDGTSIVRSSGLRTTRPGWILGAAAGLGVLVGGLVTLAVFGWRADPVSPVGPGPTATVVELTTTVGTVSSTTTSPAQGEAVRRAQEEARRREAEAAARRAAQGAIPYLGLSLPDWEFIAATETPQRCGNAPDPLLGVRWATYAAPGATGRHVVIEVVSRYALCPSDSIPTSVDDLRPPADTASLVDHGTTVVMDHEARIVEEGGVYWVMWLLDETGSSARIIVFPGLMPLTLEDVVAVTMGVIELAPDEWDTLLADSSSETTLP